MSGRELSESTQDEAVLVVYVEPLVRDRRVLFVGDAGGDAFASVVRRAARVLAFDTTKGARRARLPNGVVEPYDPFEIEAIDESFDVVVVPDVLALGKTLEDRLDDFARIVGGRGFVVAGLPFGGRGLDHEELWDLLAVRFDAVRVCGTARIHAVAVAELGPEVVPTVVVDGSLVTQPARTRGFVAVAGQTDPAIDPYLLVQLDELPAASDSAPSGRVRELEDELVSVVEALAAARTQAATLKTERDAQRDDRKRVERELREAREVESRLHGRLGELEESLRSAPSVEEIRTIEARASAQVDRLRELESEVERRGRLVRELVEETRERPAGGGDPVAIERALERVQRAEAERAEALFLVDELRARLADYSDAGIEAMREREADLSGRVRGMRSRLAEVEQGLSTSEAALTAARNERRAKAASEATASELQLSVQVGHLVGQLMVSRERELEARQARDIARAESLSFVAQVGALETQVREQREALLARIDRIARAADESASVDVALDRLEAVVESIRGECTGLRLRSDALERSVAAPEPRATVVHGSAGPDELSSELSALRLENAALLADLADAKDAAQRTGGVVAATRDALVERLQLELADNERRALQAEERERAQSAEVLRLRDAVVSAAATLEEREALVRRNVELERDLRDAISAAERAAEDARDQAARASNIEFRFGTAEASAAETRAALEETRAILDELRSAADSSRAGHAGVRADLGAEFGGADDRGARDDGGEKDLLLRALTGQLEERDDRIRALERQLSGSVGAPAGDAEFLQRQLLDLEERANRLAEELRSEREARRVVEERSASTVGTAGTAAHRELERRVEAQQRTLEEAQVRLESFDRDVRALRDVFAETRAGLEHLLGASSGAGDPALAERIGELLTLLGRY